MIDVTLPGPGMFALALLSAPYWMLYVRFYWRSVDEEERWRFQT